MAVAVDSGRVVKALGEFDVIDRQALCAPSDTLHDFLHALVRQIRESEVDDYSLVAELVEELRDVAR